MRRTILAALLAVATSLGALTVAAPAEAASIACHVVKPHTRADRTIDLLMSTNHPYYTGRPFAFVLYFVSDLHNRVYSRTFSPRGRASHELYKVPSTYYIAEARGAQSGTRCWPWPHA